MNIENVLASAAAGAVKALYGADVKDGMIQLQRTRRDYEGSITLVVFPLLRLSHKKPADTAEEVGSYMKEHCDAIDRYNVVGGFLNISLAPAAWTSLLEDMDAAERYGVTPHDETSPLWMIEYSSPNTNKPLHLFQNLYRPVCLMLFFLQLILRIIKDCTLKLYRTLYIGKTLFIPVNIIFQKFQFLRFLCNLVLCNSQIVISTFRFLSYLFSENNRYFLINKFTQISLKNL